MQTALVNNLRILRVKNEKLSKFCLYMNYDTLGGSQIYISVPFLPLTKEKEMNETSKDSTGTKKTTRIYNSR